MRRFSLVLMVQLLKKILLKFDGLHYRQEYLCLGLDSFSEPLHAYLVHDGRVVKDITNLHCFVGYSPLVFALDEQHGGGDEKIEIYFSQQKQLPQQSLTPSTALAFLKMKKTGSHETVFFYEGEAGGHQFTNGFHQKIGALINHYFNRKPGNVFLDNALYKQVQIAYAIPRKISLITVGKDGFFNLFPTDLHGQPADGRYIVSLRHQGHACRQVLQAGKILLSEMPARSCKNVYALGKNHMQPLKPANEFPFSPVFSAHFNLPIADGAFAYRELELEHGFDHGIHHIMAFRILHEARVQYMGADPLTWVAGNDAAGSLAHIHNVYATWRDKNGLQSNFLLR